LHVFGPKIFLGRAPLPEILDGHYKLWPSTDHRAKFRVNRPAHFGDPMIEIKKIKHLR